jgi:hypothetical protein
MKELIDAQHDIKRDLHNILSLLKFIKEDNELSNNDNQLMLEKCLERENTLNNKVELITKYLNKQVLK